MRGEYNECNFKPFIGMYITPDTRHIEAVLARANAVCASRMRRFTRLRRRVPELIRANGGPSRAYDILKKPDRNTGANEPPTIYTALDFLLEYGLIHGLDGFKAREAWAPPGVRGMLFSFCLNCGTIRERCANRLQEAIGWVARENHFRSRRTTLEMPGICERRSRERET